MTDGSELQLSARNAGSSFSSICAATTPTAKTSAPSASSASGAKVNVFEFTDYRRYLQGFHDEKRAKNSAYTMSAFARKAGLGANSRGYLKLVIEGKRNLTPHTLRAFIEALGLDGKEALYFENLVYFNQARTAKDKDYYFKRLAAASEGRESSQFELLKSQYAYCTHWYLVAVRELVGLSDFREDPAWIASRLRGWIGKKEAQEAIEHLLRMGLIRRTESGKLVQEQPIVKIPAGIREFTIQNFHAQMIERAKESVLQDPYETRNASGVTLSCEVSEMPAIIGAINRFRDELTLRFGEGSGRPDAVIQANFQVFQLTTPKIPAQNGSTSNRKTEKEKS